MAYWPYGFLTGFATLGRAEVRSTEPGCTPTQGEGRRVHQRMYGRIGRPGPAKHECESGSFCFLCTRMLWKMTFPVAGTHHIKGAVLLLGEEKTPMIVSVASTYRNLCLCACPWQLLSPRYRKGPAYHGALPSGAPCLQIRSASPEPDGSIIPSTARNSRCDFRQSI